MTIIVPTITTDDTGVYANSLDSFLEFAPRIQVDITDGVFAPSQTINLNQLYWPSSEKRRCAIDLHLMMRRPIDWLDQVVSLSPDKVILHAESDGAFRILPRMFEHLNRFGISTGVALLPDTTVDSVSDLINVASSVLIFGGRLGYQGGEADLSQLRKVDEILGVNPNVTIEWDGGANVTNVVAIARAGVDQINVGSAISRADDVRQAWADLTKLVTTC